MKNDQFIIKKKQPFIISPDISSKNSSEKEIKPLLAGLADIQEGPLISHHDEKRIYFEIHLFTK